MLNIRRAIKTISKRLIRSYCEKHEKKKTNRQSQFKQSTWLSSLTTDWSEKVVKASYRVKKLINTMKIPFLIF